MGRVADDRVRNLIRAAEGGVRHEDFDWMVPSIRRFGGVTVARDALRSSFTGVARWMRG